MSFVKKLWKNRQSQHPSRRIMTRVDTGTSVTYDVERDEGTVSQVGDDFSAENMNDLEDRIEQAFEDAGGGNFVGVKYHASLEDYPEYPCWEDMTDAQRAKYDLEDGATINFLDEDNEPYPYSYIGMIIQDTISDTEAKVKQRFGPDTSWIQHSGYVLRGASSGVTANSATKTDGNDNAIVPYHTHGIKILIGNGTPMWSAGGFTGNTNSTSTLGYNNSMIQVDPAGTQGNTTNANIPNYKSVYIWERIS